LSFLILIPACNREPERVSPAFAWPEEGSVGVKETVSKKGHKGVVSYELSWKPDEEGTGSIVSNRGFRFESINGVSAANPRVAAELEVFAGLDSVYPDLHIDREGNLIGFRNWDAIMAQTLEIMRQTEAASHEKWDRFEQIMRNPAFRTVMERKTAAYWDVWVGAWVGLDMMTGETETFDTTSGLVGGAEIPGKVSVQCHTVLVYGGRKCFRATVETEWNPAGMKEFLPQMLGVLLEGEDVDFPIDRLVSCRRHDRVSGVYEIETLRPRDVKTRTSIEVVVKEDPDGEPQKKTRLEEHRYTFDWPDD